MLFVLQVAILGLDEIVHAAHQQHPDVHHSRFSRYAHHQAHRALGVLREPVGQVRSTSFLHEIPHSGGAHLGEF